MCIRRYGYCVRIVEGDVHADSGVSGLVTTHYSVRCIHSLSTNLLQGSSDRRHPETHQVYLFPANVRQPRHQLPAVLPHWPQVQSRAQGNAVVGVSATGAALGRVVAVDAYHSQ